MRKRLLGLAAAGAVALAGCSSTGSDPSKAVTVGLTYIPNVQFAPVYLADFGDLDVKIRHHGSDESLFSALASGDEQVTVASGDEVLQARAQGLDVISVGAFYHHYPVEIIVPADSPIQSLADLKGKKIGLPGEYGSNWFGLLAALEQGGLTRDQVDIVSVGFTQAASLVAGEVDAIVGFSNSEPVALEQMGFAARSIPLDKGTPLVGAAIVSTEGYAQQHPDELRQVISALVGGMQQAIDDPEAAVKATATWDESLSDQQAQAGAMAILQATIPLWQDRQGRASALQDLDAWDRMGPYLAQLLDQPELADEQGATNDYVD
ncbi:ABC transporter substrate-binding protein [Scrofimicrobium sp. R131]|uniref:ABC transporter substrate-binding protein n=1 Tax=Scrofimicrobium appendicitidis TaxID=3079930 RepID=A0AAU7V566_9ACTO